MLFSSLTSIRNKKLIIIKYRCTKVTRSSKHCSIGINEFQHHKACTSTGTSGARKDGSTIQIRTADTLASGNRWLRPIDKHIENSCREPGRLRLRGTWCDRRNKGTAMRERSLYRSISAKVGKRNAQHSSDLLECWDKDDRISAVESS